MLPHLSSKNLTVQVLKKTVLDHTLTFKGIFMPVNKTFCHVEYNFHGLYFLFVNLFAGNSWKFSCL